MVVHAGAARTPIPVFDGLDLGPDGPAQRPAESLGELDLAQWRCADQFIGGSGMAVARQHACSRLGNIIEIDQTQPCFDRIGYAIGALTLHEIPLRETV